MTKTKVAPGAVNSMQVALLVDESVKAPALPLLQQMVSAAAGLQPTRGDTITAQQFKFAPLPTAKAPSPITPTGILGMLKYILAGLAAIVFLFLVSRSLKKRETAELGEPTWLREIEQPRPLSELVASLQASAGGDQGALGSGTAQSGREQLAAVAAQDPERLARSCASGWRTVRRHEPARQHDQLPGRGPGRDGRHRGLQAVPAAGLEALAHGSASKAAIALVALGAEAAAEVLKHLPEAQAEKLSAEMAMLGPISDEMLDAVCDELADLTGDANAPQGGIGFTRDVLQRVVGAERAEDLIRQFLGGEPKPFEFMRSMASRRSPSCCRASRRRRSRSSRPGCAPRWPARSSTASMPSSRPTSRAAWR